ncbi:TPA: hypothetical protein NJZ87_001100 [Vibrio parahaemolyticus]|nr:hypothetical protein [Vibrio parahaemolyticus]
MTVKLVSSSLALFVAGCVTSPIELKEHNLLNVFDSQLSYVGASEIIKDMATYCDSGIFVVEYHDFATLSKASIDLKNKNANNYFMHIEVEGQRDNGSKVSVYHYMNTSVTRTMSKAIEKWVTEGSQSCVPGF